MMKKASSDIWPPSGRTKGVLVLRETALSVSSRLGIDFDHSNDQMGALWTHQGVLKSGTIFEMSWRPDNPDIGVSITIDDSETDLEDLFDIARELDLRDASAITWLSPEVIWWRRST